VRHVPPNPETRSNHRVAPIRWSDKAGDENRYNKPGFTSHQQLSGQPLFELLNFAGGSGRSIRQRKSMRKIPLSLSRRWLCPIFLIALVQLLAISGCERHRAVTSDGRVHVKVGWIGLVCEAPLFAAYENGYFKDEGLDCELVHTDWDAFQSGMAFDRFDATHTLVSYMIKPIEKGLDVKLTGGVHGGCLRIQAGVKTSIHSVEDLRGKRIAVSTLGSPPMIFASRVLAAHGMDPLKDVSWVIYPADVTEIVLNNGQVDAVADSEPIGSLLLNRNCVRTITDQMLDARYKDEFCCVIVVSGRLVRGDPATAAKLTRAIMRGAKWVGVNPRVAAKIEVEKRYVSKADVELNAAVLTKLRYEPRVNTCRSGIENQCLELKEAHVLDASTDPRKLAERAWQSLDTVTDDWIIHVPVEQVAGGGSVPLGPGGLGALAADHPACCNKCCFGD
jgi:NitT/TauT family transport system substrate-binding protein